MGQLARLDIGGDLMRPDCRKRQAAFVAPGEESCACPGIGAARVRVADIGGEEFDVAPGGRLTEVGDQRRHYIGVGLGGESAGLPLRNAVRGINKCLGMRKALAQLRLDLRSSARRRTLRLTGGGSRNSRIVQSIEKHLLVGSTRSLERSVTPPQTS
jgi:hypothetical protein